MKRSLKEILKGLGRDLKLALFFVSLVTPPLAFAESPLVTIEGGLTPIPVSISRGVAEITPVPMITILPTALPTAYSTPQFANATPLASYYVNNTTNQEIWCSFNGGTSTHFPVPAGSIWYENLSSNGKKFSGGIACIHPANTPSSGTVEIGGNQ